MDFLLLLHDEAVSDAESSSVVSVRMGDISSLSATVTQSAYVSFGYVKVVWSCGRGD